MNTTHILFILTSCFKSLRTVLAVSLLVGSLTACGDKADQKAPSSAALSSPIGAAAINSKINIDLSQTLSSLDWKSLTPAQKTALKPLAENWDSLRYMQKKKWLRLSVSFPRISPADQTKLHERMAQWAALPPKQREHARLNFAELQKITPQQKSEKWQAYQALSPLAKEKLVKSAQPTPPRTALAPKPAPRGQIKQLPLEAPQPGTSSVP